MLTIIESPFAGDRATNDLYLKRAVLNSIKRGETPFASHGFYTHFLDDNDPADRNKGIELGYKFWEHARYIVFYTDYGISSGMQTAYERACEQKKSCILRSIGKNDAPHQD